MKRCASDSEMSKQDSFCSSKNEQGARFPDRLPLKIGLLRERSPTANRNAAPRRLPPGRRDRRAPDTIAVRIVVIEPFWRNLHLSEKVLT